MAGIYIHIPFCQRRCTYCDFYSTVGLGIVDRYISAVVDEARIRDGEMRGHDGQVTTVYVGGGTPSLLTLEQHELLKKGLAHVIDWNAVEEFTVEVNPDDVSQEYIEGLVAMGVNRISMGVQSFNDAELRAIGRRHTACQAIDALASIQAAGISNVSIDLIYGLPLQSLDTWKETVAQAVALCPQHISAYALSYELGTRLWQQRERGEITEIDDETSVVMYRELINELTAAGYEHYEISNFALPGFKSRHNSSYWNDTPYLGLGASAHSYDGIVRRYNPRDIKVYIESIDAGKTAFEVEHLTERERYDEMIMVQLRTARGVDVMAIGKRFGTDALRHLEAEAQPYVMSGMLVWNNGRLRLTEPGIMISDAIIRDLMW